MLQNNVVGSVNANRRQFYRGAAALAGADRDWLNRQVSRCVAPDRIQDPFDRGPDDNKVVVELGAS